MWNFKKMLIIQEVIMMNLLKKQLKFIKINMIIQKLII